MKRRRDGRFENQLRPMMAEFGLLKAADGSARLAQGEAFELQRGWSKEPEAEEAVIGVAHRDPFQQ